jgi:alkylhydroperoxidase/carboxymuconolactone decarboxylase family protein YurZ
MAKVDEKRTKEVLERVERERGFARLWPKLLAERDPELLETLHNEVTHVLDQRNSLPRKTKEIIMMCLNAFSFYEFGFRVHLRSALKFGATEDELLEALEVVGLSNLHGMTSMLPVLVEEIKNYQKSGGAS